MISLHAIAELKAFGKKGRVSDLARFYKTAPGEYGEGDVFLGGTVPQTRSVAKNYQKIDIINIRMIQPRLLIKKLLKQFPN